MNDHDDRFDMRIQKDLKRRFHIECVKRDVSMAFMIKDYIAKQLRFWKEQERKNSVR